MQNKCIRERERIYCQRSSSNRNTINSCIERAGKTTTNKTLPSFWQPEFFMDEDVLLFYSRQIPVKWHLPCYILCISIKLEIVDSIVVRYECSIMILARVNKVITINISDAKIRIKFWRLFWYEEISIIINSKDFNVNMI